MPPAPKRPNATPAPRLVEVRRSPLHGWGVFATTALEAGTVVDVAPYLTIPIDEWLHAGSLATYVFELDDDHVALALGTVSLYNHASTPNAAVSFDHRRTLAYVETLTDVDAGVELYISYTTDGDLSAWGIEPDRPAAR